MLLSGLLHSKRHGKLLNAAGGLRRISRRAGCQNGGSRSQPHRRWTGKQGVEESCCVNIVSMLKGPALTDQVCTGNERRNVAGWTPRWLSYSSRWMLVPSSHLSSFPVTGQRGVKHCKCDDAAASSCCSGSQLLFSSLEMTLVDLAERWSWGRNFG